MDLELTREPWQGVARRWLPRLIPAASCDAAHGLIRVSHALRSVGLNHRLSTLPRLLSGGEQQRVAIARAVVNQPELLLADEPTGNLDPDLAVEIMRLFREVNAKGTTVVVATHDRDLIQRMQRRTVVLSGGEVKDPGERSA